MEKLWGITRKKKVVEESSWWEKHGVDLALMVCTIAATPAAFLLMGHGSTIAFIAGFLLLGYVHGATGVKFGHCAIHDSLVGTSKFWNRVMSILFVEFWGGFTDAGGREAHIQMHHPYTNIIGLGDSSVWKVPILGRVSYLFIGPIFLPLIYPLVAINLLGPRPLEILRLLVVIGLGYWFQIWLFMNVSGLTFGAALLCMFLVRSIYAIPYIHVNIFQHIGLPMFDPKNKPKSRLFQMSNGVLNLPRIPLLDYTFGHGLISCHVEHHLFPRLSDNMCLKIKPVVSSYLRDHGLPYNEDTYMDRLKMFYNRYDELMVNAPKITELVGIQ
ncbi:predicted protein [Nematostella vectensis]|uniref:Fatty acid desaturase domain-containing protein n=2 Tax=Nematostella vectensis TaxID=45351 RepID=A7T940_NEMVE|nr:predicted protein [Nematostella vectensis]|eukprot:XP_001619594.1 hypothetical protein NEMVEDRAFT_v1g248846 [Nematostella vectensis]